MLEPYVLNSQTSSFVQNSQTSSFTLNSQTSSMLEPYVLTSQTSSFVLNSQTSSMLEPYVLTSQTSSFVTNAQTNSLASLGVTGNTILSNNLILTGSFDQIGSSDVYLRGLKDQTTATTHVVTFDNATGKLFITASNAFGGGGGGGSTPGGGNDTIQYNNGGVLGGSSNFRFKDNIVSLTGSLLVSGGITTTNTIQSNGGFTGDLTGTASFASTASFVQNAQTASYVLNAVSSSFATTASFVQNSISSSFASTASFVQNSVSASFAATASSINTTNLIIPGDILASGVISAGGLTVADTIVGTITNATNAYNSSLAIVSLTSSLAQRNLLTASVNLNTIYFTKGDGSTFNLIIDTGSGASGFTPSLSTDLIARNITASANISASGDLSIRGFSSVSASIASLSTGVGTLAQVTALGASTTTPITASIISASSFTGSLFGTASWAINVVNGGGGGSVGTLAQVTALGASTTTPITASIISASLFTGQTINADEFNLTGTGVPTIISDTNLNLSASNAVVVKSPIFRLTPTTTSSAEGNAQDGDIIYDNNQNIFFGRANGIWVAFN
jgi:hypothetical protein